MMKAFKEWFIWKWGGPECNIQGLLSHWDKVTAELTLDGGKASEVTVTCSHSPAFRGDTEEEEKSLSALSRLADSSSWPAELLLPPPQLRVTSCCDASYRRKGRPLMSLPVFCRGQVVSVMYWYHIDNNTVITWRLWMIWIFKLWRDQNSISGDLLPSPGKCYSRGFSAQSNISAIVILWFSVPTDDVVKKEHHALCI